LGRGPQTQDNDVQVDRENAQAKCYRENGDLKRGEHLVVIWWTCCQILSWFRRRRLRTTVLFRHLHIWMLKRSLASPETILATEAFCMPRQLIVLAVDTCS
jgi:hypothetical protein